jgi:hypothetical protein
VSGYAGTTLVQGAAVFVLCGVCGLTQSAWSQAVRRSVESANENEDARPVFSRIDAIAGSRIIVPIDASVFFDARSKSIADFAVLLEDGTRLTHTLHAVRVQSAVGTYVEPATTPFRMLHWLGSEVKTTSREVTREEALALPGEDSLVIAIDPPARAASSTIWIGTQRVPVQWLPAIATMVQTESGLDPATGSRAWQPTRGPMNTVAISDLLAAQAAEPLTRWRARLVEDGLSPIHDERFAPINDPLLSVFGEQLIQRWQIALARLYLHDAKLATRLRAALGQLAEVEPGVIVPAWNPLPQATDRLLSDLLDSRIAPQRRAELAEQWLREQPAFTAWVRDDGGVLVEKDADSVDGRRTPLATIALTNLSATEELAWIAPRDSAAAPDPRPLEPRKTLAVATPVMPLDAAGQQMAQRGVTAMLAPDSRRDITATLGNDAVRLSVIDGPIAITPPGLATGVFARDMRLAEWLSATTPTDEPAWATAAMFFRAAPSPSDPGTTNPRRLWQIFVECAMPADADRSRESIWIYTGTPGAAAAVWRVSLDGTITGMRAQDRELTDSLGEDLGSGGRRAEVIMLDGRAMVRIPLPPGAIEEDGLVRIGLVRMDARGVRSAWPRALTPWQDEPSRAVVDTRAWDGRVERP